VEKEKWIKCPFRGRKSFPYVGLKVYHRVWGLSTKFGYVLFKITKLHFIAKFNQIPNKTLPFLALELSLFVG
jgi:hypothetical protein